MNGGATLRQDGAREENRDHVVWYLRYRAADGSYLRPHAQDCMYSWPDRSVEARSHLMAHFVYCAFEAFLLIAFLPPKQSKVSLVTRIKKL
jgi:hypothetical protein